MRTILVLVMACAALATASIASAAPPWKDGAETGWRAIKANGEPAGPWHEGAAPPPFGKVTALASTSGCREVYAGRVRTSVPLGTLLYRFRQYVRWCWQWPRVTNPTRRVEAYSDDLMWHWMGLNSSQAYYWNWCCATMYSGWHAYMKGWFQQRTWPGGIVLGNTYPWAQIRPHADGSWTYATGA